MLARMLVHFLPPDVTGLLGFIGMTAAPGVHRALDIDLNELRDRHRTSMLVSLVGDEELKFLRIMDLAPRALAAGIETVRFPISDHSTPDSMDAFLGLIDRILAHTSLGRTAVVHCWAGLGRTGLVAASCLVARGFAPGDAIATVRRHRPRTIEDTDQEDFVSTFAAVWAAR